MSQREYHSSPSPKANQRPDDQGDIIAQAVSSSAVLTKRHGTTLRLTPAGKVLMARRLRELCVAQVPGTEIRAILNDEFVLDWRLATYWKLVRDLRLQWIPTPRAGRQKGATEYFPEDQWKPCYEDPAYEPRNGIRDRLVCRECLREALADPTRRVPLLKDGSMQGKRHLWAIHKIPSLKEYRRLHPEAPIFTCERIASTSKPPKIVEAYMAEVCEKYVTPEVRAAAEKDREYEDRNDIATYVICREARCGLKCVDLQKHLWSQHRLTTIQYRAKHNWPQIMSRDEREKAAKREQERMKRILALGAKGKRILAGLGRKPGRKTSKKIFQEFQEKLSRAQALLEVTRKLDPEARRDPQQLRSALHSFSDAEIAAYSGTPWREGPAKAKGSRDTFSSAVARHRPQTCRAARYALSKD